MPIDINNLVNDLSTNPKYIPLKKAEVINFSNDINNKKFEE